MTDVEQTPPQQQPPQNGYDIGNDDEAGKTRPADIEQDMREMERRKRVDAIMSSKMFREELERIVDSAREGGTHGILQHLSDIVGIPQSRLGNVFKSNNCVVPINDIRGIETIGYTKGEKILRCKLASTFRLLDLFNWSQGDLGTQITARLKVDQEIFLVNPYGLLYNEITASSLNKVDIQGNVVEHGTTNFLVNKNHFSLHSAVHAARPDIRCAIYIGCSPVVAISSLRTGLLPLTKDACVLGEITTFPYTGALLDAEERDRLVRNLGPISKILLLSNHGALCCGETIEEAFYSACRIIQACETQLQLLPVGLDNLVLIPDETRKIIYEQARRPPDDLANKFTTAVSITEDETDKDAPTNNKEAAVRVIGAAPKWRVGGAEFEALMRMLDNAGFRTGYIYRHPLIKSELRKPKNDVELPPAVSSLGYLLEEEEYFRQGIWKKGDLRKGGDRSKWLNSPNVYQKVEVLETGTPDPKKITKWVAEGSPTHSTPVRIEDPLQFVPVGTTSKEFKRIQQQIKENRRADKISAGPQSHILEGVTWDEANRSFKDGTVTTAGDHVVVMGAASKGIIQRGFQHNAAVYKTPYAKNPFDHVTDDEINEYTRTVERKKKSIHGEYTDTDFSESEPLSSLQTSGGQKQTTTSTTAAAVSHSEPEDAAHQVLRIQTQQAPVPSQAEVVMSDASLDFINGERSHTATNRKPPTGRASIEQNLQFQAEADANVEDEEEEKAVIDNGAIKKKSLTPSEQDFKIYRDNFKRNKQLISDLKNALLFKKQQQKYCENTIDNENSQFMMCSDDVVVEGGNLSTGARKDNEILAFNNMSENINRKLGLQQPLPSPPPPPPLPLPPKNPNYQTMTNYFMTLKRAPGQQRIDCLSNCSGISCNKYCCEPDPQCEHSDPLYYMPDHQRYKVASNCLTPSNCQMIFESLQRTAKSEQAPWSTASTPCLNTPRNRRSRNMIGQVQYNPYRTVSHFGFNSPRQPLEPEHKHIPNDLRARRYVPMRRSNSYEEIFTSRLYADLCEHCFARLLRLKPDILHVRTRLRNLADISPGKCTYYLDDSKDTVDNVELHQYEYIEPSQCILMQLPTVVELDENRSSVDALQNGFQEKSTAEELRKVEEKHVDDTVNNTFVDKIMSFNYSEESTNIHFEPPLTESILSIDGLRGDEAPHKDDTPMLLASEKPQKGIKPKINILSVIDLGNWREHDAIQACQYKDPNAVQACVNAYDNDTEQSYNDETVSVDRMDDDYSSGHNSMSRTERSRRKLEFQEIWEDHLNYQLQQDESAENDVDDNTVDLVEEICRPATPQYVHNYGMDQEVFHGCSLIMQNVLSNGIVTDTHDAYSQTCEVNNQNNNDDRNLVNNEIIFTQASQYFEENENTVTYCIFSKINNNAMQVVDLESFNNNNISNLENLCNADDVNQINGIQEEPIYVEEEIQREMGTLNQNQIEISEDEELNSVDKENSLMLELVVADNVNHINSIPEEPIYVEEEIQREMGTLNENQIEISEDEELNAVNKKNSLMLELVVEDNVIHINSSPEEPIYVEEEIQREMGTLNENQIEISEDEELNAVNKKNSLMLELVVADNVNHINGSPEEPIYVNDSHEEEEIQREMRTLNQNPIEISEDEELNAVDKENSLMLELLEMDTNEDVDVLFVSSSREEAPSNGITFENDAQNDDEKSAEICHNSLGHKAVTGEEILPSVDNNEIATKEDDEADFVDISHVDYYYNEHRRNTLRDNNSNDDDDDLSNEELARNCVEEFVNKINSVALENEFVDTSVQTSLCMLNWERLTQRVSDCRLNSEKLNSSGNVDGISFNPVECEILRRIEEHELKVKDKIFQEIDTSIRNKLTTNRLLSKIKNDVNETRDLNSSCKYYLNEFLNHEEEKPTTSANARKLLLRKKICTARDILDEAMSDAAGTTTTTTNESDAQEHNSETGTESESENIDKQFREECTRTPSTITLSSEDIQGVNNLPKNGKFCTAKEFNFVLTGMLQRDWSPPHNTKSAPEFRTKDQLILEKPCQKLTEKESEQPTTSRDFIRENIMKAGVPHRARSHKNKNKTTIHSNVSSIFGTNPFGPVLDKNIQKYPSMTAAIHSIENTEEEATTSKYNKQTSSTSSGSTKPPKKSPVYSFETQKHQRFWMSMSPTARRRTMKLTRNSAKNSYFTKSSSSQGNTSVCNSSTPVTLRRKLFKEMPNVSQTQDNIKPCSPRLNNFPNDKSCEMQQHNLCGKRKINNVSSEVLYKQSREQDTTDEQSETYDSDDNTFDNDILDTEDDDDKSYVYSESNLTFTEQQYDAAENTEDD